MCSTLAGSVPTCKYYNRLERLARDKCPSLFGPLFRDKEESLITLTTGLNAFLMKSVKMHKCQVGVERTFFTIIVGTWLGRSYKYLRFAAPQHPKVAGVKVYPRHT
jgi:hypothetical protein